MKTRLRSRRIAGQDPRMTKTAHHVDAAQAAWVMYQMKLRGLTQQALGSQAGVTGTMIRSVIYGRRRTARIQKLIALALGFATWAELLAARTRAGVAA
jgi:lambda repressor-like predicted transcriptional regulator